MKVALISDIHGNAVALEAALAAIEEEGVDRVVCLGDVAATGAQPRQVIRRLRELGCPVVMGNTDAQFLSPPSFAEDAGEHQRVMQSIHRRRPTFGTRRGPSTPS